MAVLRLASIHMSSPLHDHNRTMYKDKESHDLLQLDTRLPSLPLKRPANAFPLHEDLSDHQSDARMSFDGFAAVLSPSQRKRRRGDSQMSDASPPYGSVRITSTSIHTVIRGESEDKDSHPRYSVTSEDAEFTGRNSWAGTSSRGSGRDSDLWDDMTSPRTENEQGIDDRSSVSNATRNITFEMLQAHFCKSLKDAANHFGVCTTLLKKICRKNGILSWPYRQIIGLEKSIASMEQQVHYFDGEQRRQYAAQLNKLRIKLDTYIRTGRAPGDEELAAAVQADAIPTSTESQPKTTQPLHEEYKHQGHHPPVAYYYPPQGTVMASTVTLESEEPPQRYEVQIPSHSFGNDYRSYDQRYTGTTYLSPTSYYTQRPLPSLASILAQPTPSGHYMKPEARDPFEQDWHSKHP